MSVRLPDFGPRGEGWFAIQVVLIVAIVAAGAAGPAWSGTLRRATAVAGVVLIAAGGLLAVRGVFDLRDNLTVFPRPIEGARLVQSGVYRLVRHPIYGGLILAAAGYALVAASPLALVGAVVLAAFFELKSRREEAWLAEEQAGYESYRRRTRRFVPWLY